MLVLGTKLGNGLILDEMNRGDSIKRGLLGLFLHRFELIVINHMALALEHVALLSGSLHQIGNGTCSEQRSISTGVRPRLQRCELRLLSIGKRRMKKKQVCGCKCSALQCRCRGPCKYEDPTIQFLTNKTHDLHYYYGVCRPHIKEMVYGVAYLIWCTTKEPQKIWMLELGKG